MTHFRPLGWAASIALLLILTACVAPIVPADPGGEPQACTLIGCESQLAFELTADILAVETYEIEACVDADCTSTTLDIPRDGFATSESFTVDAVRDVVTVRLLGDDYSGTHAVSLTLVGQDGARIAVEAETEFARAQPNGPGCEPVCWQATVRA